MAVSIFQNGGRRHLAFLKFHNFNSQKGHGVKLRQVTTFCVDCSKRYWDMASFRFFPRWRTVVRVFESPTKGIWWSLSLCKIWMESIQ